MAPEKHCNPKYDVVWAMDMTDYICLCEIVIHEVLASQNVLRAELSVHARCIGGPVPGLKFKNL